MRKVSMDLGLRSKKALITGGSHGIGLAIKKLLNTEGCQVRSISRREGYDIFDKAQLRKALNLANDIDILINNIGGGGRWGNEDPLKTELNIWD